MAGHWPFPPLIGVIGTQTLRPDGSLLCNPGYDVATGLYLHEPPPPMPVIPDRPTKKRRCRLRSSDLNELLTDFPFVDNVDRSVAMSMQMTPVLRAALGPAVPIHVVNAPAPKHRQKLPARHQHRHQYRRTLPSPICRLYGRGNRKAADRLCNSWTLDDRIG